MNILFINNDGAGFADKIQINAELTLGQLFALRCPHSQPKDYLIRVNRQPSTSDQPLVEGDRVSITPRKIEGAQRSSR
jgi:hypothetical protein